MILDTNNVDIYPLIVLYSNTYKIQPVLLLACIKAESNLNLQACRYGQWPDVSFGYGQMTVATAKQHGLGDGTKRSVEIVRDALCNNRELSIEITAKHLVYCQRLLSKKNIEITNLNTLIVYNAGHYPAPNGAYWASRKKTIKRYEDSLSWAQKELEKQ